MTKQEFISNYLNKNKELKRLPYGMKYYSLLASLEEKAERKWEKLKKANDCRSICKFYAYVG